VLPPSFCTPPLPLPRLPPPPVVAPFPTFGVGPLVGGGGRTMEVRARGKGEGISSMRRECTEDGYRWLFEVTVGSGAADCGGDNPAACSWCRNFLVICCRDCASNVSSFRIPSPSFSSLALLRLSSIPSKRRSLTRSRPVCHSSWSLLSSSSYA